MIAIRAATANSHHLTARFGGASYAEMPVIEPVLNPVQSLDRQDLDRIAAPLIVRPSPRATGPSFMTIRTRKFFGTFFLLILVVVWSLMGMTIAQTPWLANSGLLQAVFYVVAGLGWVLPAMPIVSWMSRPDT
jgi:hypothetical protein